MKKSLFVVLGLMAAPLIFALAITAVPAHAYPVSVTHTVVQKGTTVSLGTTWGPQGLLPIDMTYYTGGSLAFANMTNTTGTQTIKVYTSEDGVTYVPAYKQEDNGSFVVMPTITTPSGTKSTASYQFNDLKGRYVLFVCATTSSTKCKGVYSFTPSN